jgi:peroxiredoxin Q/BCP
MKIVLICLFILITATLSCIAICPTKNKLKVGDIAPDFMLPDQNGVMHSLAEYRGKKVALYFYPKDDTPGCRKQACSIRDNFDKITDADITVIGLSKGTQKSKTSFAQKYALPFTLLIANKKTLSDYGTSGTLFTLFLPKRRTFLINEDGIIIAIIDNISVGKHAQQIIDGFNHAQ